jgi:CheY-like chemotaxis protein
MMSTNTHILVVEGSRTQAELLKLVLQTHGYEVTVATAGAEAVALARTILPALILSGIALSGMDGYMLCAALKQEAGLKDIPVVLLTALSDVEDLMRGLKAQVDYYIAKPYEEDDLLARISAILSRPVQPSDAQKREQLMVTLRGKPHEISVGCPQLLRLLLSTYENYTAALQRQHALTATHVQLKAQYQQLQEEQKRLQTVASTAHQPLVCQGPTVSAHATDTDSSGPGRRILVAEDNPVNRLVLVRLLEKLGYRTDEATNGLEAVEACAASPYAAVLMEVQMPTMGGFEATDHIRQQNATRGTHTPIIAVTAHTLPSDREQCLAAGMDDYLPKPVNPEALQAALTRWLGRPVGGAERVQ